MWVKGLQGLIKNKIEKYRGNNLQIPSSTGSTIYSIQIKQEIYISLKVWNGLLLNWAFPPIFQNYVSINYYEVISLVVLHAACSSIYGYS